MKLVTRDNFLYMSNETFRTPITVDVALYRGAENNLCCTLEIWGHDYMTFDDNCQLSDYYKDLIKEKAASKYGHLIDEMPAWLF